MKTKLLNSRSSVFFSLVGIGVVVLVAASSQLYTLSQLRTLQNQEQSVNDHAALMNDIQSGILTAESSQRGYIITNNPNYLEPYTKALPQLKRDLARLPGITVSSAQHKNFMQIQSLGNQKLQEMQGVIDAFQSGGISAAETIIQTDHGKQLMDGIQSVIANAKARQVSALDKQKARTNHDLTHTLWMTPILLVLTLFIVVLTFYLSRRAVEHERSLEKARSEFIDIAAHQLRTPATSVKQYIGLLLGGYMGKLNAKQREALETANASNDHELNIVEDILRVARADGGDIVLHKQTTDLAELLNGVVTDYEMVLDNRKQGVSLKLPKKAVKADLDPTYIRLVFDNLLDNACKYSADDTKITISLKVVRNRACIAVVDQGVGIAKRDQVKLFKKFSRIENSRSAAVGGTGLGLYWVRKIVELHEGTVSVHSNRGNGTTFSVELPL